MVQIAKGILPPGMPGYRPDYEGLSFNPQKAKELLSQSKYGGPAGLPRIKLTISGTGSAPSVILQGIVQMWKDNLGVEVILESIDYVTFLDQIKKGRFQMFSLGWVADYPDPEDFIDLKFHSKRSKANNETGYANSEVDKLIELARVEKSLVQFVSPSPVQNCVASTVPSETAVSKRLNPSLIYTSPTTSSGASGSAFAKSVVEPIPP